RPFLVAPSELQRQVVVAEGCLRPQFAKHFTRNPDGRASVHLHDGEDVQRVTLGSDRLEVLTVLVALDVRDGNAFVWRRNPGRPPVERATVPERCPTRRRRLDGGKSDRGGGKRDSHLIHLWRMSPTGEPRERIAGEGARDRACRGVRGTTAV